MTTEVTTTTAAASAVVSDGFLPCAGLDIGTANICVCRRSVDGAFLATHHRNILFEMDASDEASDLLRRSHYLHLQTDGRYYIVGEDALRFVNAIGQGEIARPMRDGLLNPSLKKSQALINHIIEVVVGKPLEPGEPLRFSLPANPVDRPETNNVFHKMVLTELLKRLGYSPKPINEAMANVYSEAPSMTTEEGKELPLTGLSISCGAGMSNVCLAVNGMPAVEFSVTKSGDHIDQQVAAATGERPTQVLRIKEQRLDLGKPAGDDRVLQALAIYYEEFVSRIFRRIAQEFTAKSVTLDGPIDVLICGGTAMPKNFIQMAEERIRGLDLPFRVANVRLASEPFYAVARGCCLAAIADKERAG